MSKKKERGRFSSQKKTDAVLRLLRGEELDALSRELGVTAATLSSWREAFLAAGQAGLKIREPSASDAENLHLKALVGDLTMQLEVSRDAVRRLRENLPLVPRKSRR
jgi:transposase